MEQHYDAGHVVGGGRGLSLVALVSAYLSWTAARVDGCTCGRQSAARALDAHLLRRAAAAAVLAERARTRVELYAAARIALDAAPDEREAAENDLTRQLRAVRLDPADPACRRRSIAASRRLALARQVHTDLVRDALSARDRPLVRLFRMARRHDRAALLRHRRPDPDRCRAGRARWPDPDRPAGRPAPAVSGRAQGRPPGG